MHVKYKNLQTLFLSYIKLNQLLPRGQSVLTPANDLIMSMHLWR